MNIIHDVIFSSFPKNKVIPIPKNISQFFLFWSSFTFEYKFKIKDKNNMLIKADVNSSFGVVTDLDSYYD